MGCAQRSVGESSYYKMMPFIAHLFTAATMHTGHTLAARKVVIDLNTIEPTSYSAGMFLTDSEKEMLHWQHLRYVEMPT